MRLHLSLIDNDTGSKILNALKNDSFAVCLIPLELKRDHKEDDAKVGESKV